MRTKYSDISLTGSNTIDSNTVVAAIKNIIKTKVGERVHERGFGSNIENLLFEPFVFLTGRKILSELIYSISKWEKRVTVEGGSNVHLNPETRSYDIILNLRVKGFDDPLIFRETLSTK